MNTQDQSTLNTLASEVSDDIVLGKRLVAAYRKEGRNGLLKLLPDVIHEAQEDFAAITAAAPVIKSGWRTSEFWAVLCFALVNAVLYAWKGVALPTGVLVSITTLIGAYMVLRAALKAKGPQVENPPMPIPRTIPPAPQVDGPTPPVRPDAAV